METLLTLVVNDHLAGADRERIRPLLEDCPTWMNVCFETAP
jgi:hypothetical protein